MNLNDFIPFQMLDQFLFVIKTCLIFRLFLFCLLLKYLMAAHHPSNPPLVLPGTDYGISQNMATLLQLSEGDGVNIGVEEKENGLMEHGFQVWWLKYIWLTIQSTFDILPLDLFCSLFLSLCFLRQSCFLQNVSVLRISADATVLFF